MKDTNLQTILEAASAAGSIVAIIIPAEKKEDRLALGLYTPFSFGSNAEDEVNAIGSKSPFTHIFEELISEADAKNQVSTPAQEDEPAKRLSRSEKIKKSWERRRRSNAMKDSWARRKAAAAEVVPVKRKRGRPKKDA